MGSFPLPTRLAEIAGRAPELREWVAELPAAVALLTTRWSLTLGPPFQPGGEVSWVAPARDPAGRDLVLKVGWGHPEARYEGAGLRAWRDRGAVWLHEEHPVGQSIGLLLERARPGTALSTAHAEPEQDEAVAALLRELWHEPAPDHPFRTLIQLCGEWADEFEQDYAAQASSGPAALDPGLARAGMELFRGLARDGQPPLQLATDLHAGNVLAARRRAWLLIDPKPHVGDPVYDVLQHLLNCRNRLTADPGALADRMAALLDLDRKRLRLWLFARCVQECVQQPWLRPVASSLRP
jgi:streptomycin 6-kinase